MRVISLWNFHKRLEKIAYFMNGVSMLTKSMDVLSGYRWQVCVLHVPFATSVLMRYSWSITQPSLVWGAGTSIFLLVWQSYALTSKHDDLLLFICRCCFQQAEAVESKLESLRSKLQGAVDIFLQLESAPRRIGCFITSLCSFLSMLFYRRQSVQQGCIESYLSHDQPSWTERKRRNWWLHNHLQNVLYSSLPKLRVPRL